VVKKTWQRIEGGPRMSQVKSMLCMLLVVCFSITATVGAQAHTVQERVMAGASFLDERSPGWDEKINLAGLDMGNDYRCILGQLYKHYRVGKTELNITTRTSRDLGFDSISGTTSAYHRITVEWGKLIRERRAKAKM